jgi:hypothetical protein
MNGRAGIAAQVSYTTAAKARAPLLLSPAWITIHRIDVPYFFRKPQETRRVGAVAREALR